MITLQEYGGGSSDEESLVEADRIEDMSSHLKPLTGKRNVGSSSGISTSLVAFNPAPDVAPNESLDPRRLLKPDTKELSYNPKYEDLFAPHVGPQNPFKSEQQLATKNTLTGFVQPANVNEFQFENQRRTFDSYGFAHDPSHGGEEESSDRLLGSSEAVAAAEGKTVFEKTKPRPADKRKRFRNDDSGDVDGYLGPWGGFVDEKKIARPEGEDAEAIEEYLAKKQRRSRNVEEKPLEEKSTFHLKEAVDYQGRSFLEAPRDTGVNLLSDEPPHKCFIPKKLIHTWTGHNKGLSAIKWFPQTAHLLLSASMDTKIKIWEVYNTRRCVRTYLGHRQAVRDVCFSNDGKQFLSASYDRFVKLWDTETGECISRFTNRKVPYCVKFNPEEDKQHLFVAGTQDKKIVCWDTRSGEIVQEYDRHLGPVNTITFVDDNRRFVSTSDDKSLRVWEWDIPVDMKYIADPSMHSMPAVTMSPNQKWLACQSMDNKICIFSALNRFKFHQKKTFKGHMVAGYACSVDFSPDMSYLISGDADGKVFVWDWKTTRLVTKWKAHSDVCISVLWHPHETSKVASAGWDGAIHYWD
ncbi:unnamed protein product [Cyprideis torosa]|uniref:Pre-mRNA-processing factor 17 n=1 Tax=Cyprideis torosa TaxID=163714 RepID=A0A7R8ZQ22_9CRUS|nr:unnamed protein product [Cyprideis torosa]CAG0900334.1 unnamed protein product [Cyprideis torosa]